VEPNSTRYGSFRTHEHDPEPLPGVQDRAWDVWLPLLVVADIAGGRWPLLARQA
jgi:hypothetical protein